MPLNQTGDITLYAHWLELPGEDFAINDCDKDVLNDIVPQIIVNAAFTNKKYTLTNAGLDSGYASRYYRYGEKAFTTLADAIAAASANDVIYVFAGTYSSNIDINISNVKVIGPNYQVLGKDTRNSAANITGILTISASNVEVNGLEFTRNVIISASNATIDYCHISCTPESCGDSSVNGHNRKACIINGNKTAISNLTINHSYINASGTNSYLTDYIALYNINTLNIRNSYITNDCATLPGSSPTNDGMMIYTMTGTLNIYDNEFYYATNNYLMRVGNTSTDATINVYNNVFSGRSGLVTCTLGFLKLSNSSSVIVKNNQFYNLEPATISTGDDATSAEVDIEYNYFDGQLTRFRTASTNVTTNHNCYHGGTQTTGTNAVNINADAVKYSSLSEVQAAYNSANPS